MGAGYHRGTSRQDLETPPEFFQAVVKRFGQFDVDLAANKANTKARVFFSEKTDALKSDWGQLSGCKMWLNPPFGNIAKWLDKSHRFVLDDGNPATSITCLLPASVSSNWFNDYVYAKADVYFIRPRLTFVGQDAPYPKDLMLVRYLVPLEANIVVVGANHDGDAVNETYRVFERHDRIYTWRWNA